MTLCVYGGPCRLLKKIERDIDPEKERDLKIREGAALEKLEKKQAKKVRHMDLCSLLIYEIEDPYDGSMPMTRNELKVHTPALCRKELCAV
jgi:hypothetical protein